MVVVGIHASTEAGTLRVGLSVISVAIYYADDSVTTKVIRIVFFILLTAPEAAHLIHRAAYLTASPLWDPTIVDDDCAVGRADSVNRHDL